MNYGNKKYWEDRYEQTKQNKNKKYVNEWYIGFSQVENFVEPYLKSPSDKILNVGCGRSEISVKLYEKGYHNITNIDISENLIYQLKEENKDKEGMIYEVMDAQHMFDFSDETFHVVIDKGTIDSLFSNIHNIDAVRQYISEVERVIKTDGLFLIVTYGVPETRLLYFNQSNWHIRIAPVQASGFYHILLLNRNRSQ